jgi:hypothetical protein
LMYSKPPQSLKIHYERTKLPALQRFFSFPVWRGRIAWHI